MKTKSNKKWVFVPIIIAILAAIILFGFYMVNYSNLGKSFGIKSACSSESKMTVLLVGIDYRGEDYLYGLADVIRFAEIDFDQQAINMVALPRDLLVDIPADRFKVPGPYKLNQAYFFGTPGMLNYLGEGEGPAALNDVIKYNFGVSADHYVVFNFIAVVDFINAIGGVNVNLPEPVYGGSQGDFPAGEQLLSGERALALSRIRENYSDAFRVGNQSLIIKAIFTKLLQPTMILKYPILIGQFKDAILTDLPLDQLSSLGLCFRDFDSENLVAHEVPGDYLTLQNIYLMSLNDYTYGFSWDNRMVEWINASLEGKE